MPKYFLTAVCLCLAVGCSSEPNIGTVPFELSDPNADVSVTVDGKPIQVTSLRQPFDFSVGDHELRVEGDRYETIERTLQVVSGENPVLRIDLVPTSKQTGGRDDARVIVNEAAKSEAQISAVDMPTPETGPLNVVDGDAPEESQSGRELDLAPNALTAREKEVAQWVVSVGGRLTAGNGLGIILSRDSHVSEVDFKRFQDLPHLHTLGFAGVDDGGGPIAAADLSDDHLLKLSGLPKLRVVGVQGPGVTDKSMEHLAKFPIEELTLENSSVTDEGIARFSRHKLSILSLPTSRLIGDDGLLRLDLSRARTLGFQRTGMTDRFLKTLSGSPGLTKLNVGGTKITGKGLSGLHDTRQLVELWAYGVPIQDDHLRHLQNHKNLAYLNIAGTNVTADGVRFVATCFPRLGRLRIGGLDIPRSQIIDWKFQQNLENLFFEENHIGNPQLQSFTTMRKLKDLRISTDSEYFTASRQGLLAFKRALPDCTVNGKSVDVLIRELSR